MSRAGAGPYRLAVVDTNPVQYRVPLWRAIASSGRFDLEVFYATKVGLVPAKVEGFGETWTWDIPLLDGYPHRFLPTRRIPLLKGPTANQFPLGLFGILKRTPFDAVLVLGYVGMAPWAGILAGWRSGTPILLRGDTHLHGPAARRSWRRKLKNALLPRLLKRVDGVLASGTWNEAYWESFGVSRAKMATATHAVDNDFFRQRAEEVAGESAALRASWRASEGDTVFLFAARLVEVKAPDLLLKAFSALSGEPRAHLVMVGNGPLEGALRAEQEALGLLRVHWAGFVNQRELPVYYRAADIVVLPSRFEPWGLVVNEAMACGTPCIVSDVVGAGGDLVEGHETGLVFRSEDAGDLAEALKAALDPGLRSRWKANLPQTLEKASFHRNVAALESLLNRVTVPRSRLTT